MAKRSAPAIVVRLEQELKERIEIAVKACTIPIKQISGD